MTFPLFLFILILIVFGVFFVSQMIVFFKDVRFYRRANWDLVFGFREQNALFRAIEEIVLFQKFPGWISAANERPICSSLVLFCMVGCSLSCCF